MIFGGGFLKNEVASIANSEAFASRKKTKPHVTVLSIVKVFFPVLIFKIYQFSKFWKILALNEKKTNFGILKNKLHSKQFWDIYAFWNFEGFNFFIIFGEVLSCPKFAFLKVTSKFSWTYTLEFLAEKKPQKSKNKSWRT